MQAASAWCRVAPARAVGAAIGGGMATKLLGSGCVGKVNVNARYAHALLMLWAGSDAEMPANECVGGSCAVWV